MNVTVIVSCLLGIFSTTVMSYIAMATPVGPWIAPTLVLCGLLLSSWVYRKKDLQDSLVYSTISASIGGILATAFGFSFPTLYFLDASLFNQWLARPIYFASVCSVIALAAGWYGLWIANVTEDIFLKEKQLPFPIGQMIYKMIMAQRQIKKAIELAVGFIGTLIFCILQDGLYAIQSIIPKTLQLCSAASYYCFNVPTIQLDLWPMLWAIGFVTGQVIVLPLLIGSLSKFLLIQPIQQMFFPDMHLMAFILAFCSGMVVSGLLGGLMPRNIAHLLHLRSSYTKDQLRDFFKLGDRSIYYEGAALFLFLISVLTYFGFSFFAQIYLLVFTFICSYQIIMIAGKIGLAQLGRFATFVLVPALFFFDIDVVRITIISTFVETCTGVAVDALFGRKVVALSGVNKKTAKWYQYLGLLVSSATVGVVFWVLIKHFTLGSPELFAQRSQARALLIHVQQFDYWVVLLGMVYGLLLKQLKLSPMLVLGGLLMPLNITIGLVVGGLLQWGVKDAQEWFPFWSGVFAANSIWMLIRALI